MRVTEKGQVAIPKEWRDALGIGPHDRHPQDRRRCLPRAATDAATAGRGDIAMTTDEIMALTRGD